MLKGRRNNFEHFRRCSEVFGKSSKIFESCLDISGNSDHSENLAGIYECVRRSCSAKLLLEDKSLYLLKWVKGRTSAEHDNTKS